MNRMMRQAVKRLAKMSLVERIQLQVKAELLTQEQADEAILRLAEKERLPDMPSSS